MILRRTAAVLPGIGVSLLPKLICPLCWPDYAGLVSAAGLGFLINARNLLIVTSLVLIVAVAALAFRARQRRGYGPAIAGLAAGVGILAGKFYLESAARCMRPSACLLLRRSGIACPPGQYLHARGACRTTL